MWKLNSARGRDLAIGTAILGTVAGALLTTMGVQAASAASQVDAAKSTISELAAPVTSSDALPAFVAPETMGDGGLQAGTVHRLGSDESADYWIGIDRSNNVCAISVLRDGSQMATFGCNTAQNVEATGITFQAQHLGKGVDVYVVPDSVTVSGLPAPYKRIAPNLVTVSGGAAPTTDVTLHRSSALSRTAGAADAPSKPFVLKALPPTPKG